MAEFYPWLKALHIISVVAWMAGLLYLPRLFVYHAAAAPGSELSETFKVMERRLLRGIMNPAMIATYIFGGALLGVPGVVDWGQVWIYLKLAGIGLLTMMHHLFGLWRKDFLADRNKRTPKFYKIANEIPTLGLILVVVMVAAKPF